MDKAILLDIRSITGLLVLIYFTTNVESQCTDDTRPFSLSSSNSIQYFSSPGYPSNYPPNYDCAWFIEAPTEHDKIILNVELFRTQQDEFLRIYNGSNADGTLLAAIDDTSQNSFNAFVSPGHQLYFTFQSDGANEANGFNILFFSNQSANQHACGETISISSQPQLFMSPNLPNQFTANDNCNWLFTSSESTIQFRIFFMDMASCKPEYLSFYDGTSDQSALLTQVCETAYVYEFEPIETTGYNAYVEWTVSQNAIGYGFMLAFIQGGDATSTTVAATTSTTAADSTTAPTTIAADSTTAVITTAADSTTAPTTIAADSTTAVITTAADSTTAVITTAAESTTAAATKAGPDPTTSATTGPDTTTAQDFIGMNLTYPLADETVEFAIREDQATGYVNKSVAVIILTTVGELDLNIDPRYETTDQGANISLDDDVQLFSFTENDAPYYYLFLGKSLDYEVINMFSLLVTLVDSNVSSVTYTVTFNVTITDVNDVAPVILNLLNNVTLSRDKNAGYHLFSLNASDGDGTAENQVISYQVVCYHIFSLNASDGDGTAENQVISYQIVSGNKDGIFHVDNSSGDVTLIKDASQVPANVEEYNLVISAYSGDTSVENLGILTVSVPNYPPNCTHATVWAYNIDLTTASTGYTLTFIDSWSCTDVGDTLIYSIESVTPNLTSAFAIVSSTGTISLSRTITSTEVPNRQIVLGIAVKDQKGQTVNFSLYMNVTTMTCLPNPRNLYVRMDQELGGVILDDFNCTVNTGLTFSMKQYPPGTFQINDNSQLILTAAVVKIKFYSLTVTITHNSDVVVLTFKVIIQTRRCGVSGGLSAHLRYNKIGIIIVFFCWTFLSQFVFL